MLKHGAMLNSLVFLTVSLTVPPTLAEESATSADFYMASYGNIEALIEAKREIVVGREGL